MIHLKLTEAEAEQIANLIYSNMSEGSYYGVRLHWTQRNESIMRKLRKATNNYEVVHHKNGNPLDNEIGNIEVRPEPTGGTK